MDTGLDPAPTGSLPLVGASFPKQSSVVLPAMSQLLQKVQGEKSKSCSQVLGEPQAAIFRYLDVHPRTVFHGSCSLAITGFLSGELLAHCKEKRQ
jgi:hypothetical protein